jgi:glycosyltransferase involved in cell wall biosynthesis
MAGIEDKERANFRGLEDYVHHARMVREIFLAHRPECWTAGYGPKVEQDIEHTIHRCSLYGEERRELRSLASEVLMAPPSKSRRVLFIYGHCGLGGVETSILNKMAALRRKNVVVEAMFLQFWGEGGVFVSQYAGVHLKTDRKAQQEVLMRGWEVVIIVDTPEFLSIAIEAGVRCPVILETHASYVPALGYLHSKVSDPHVEAIVAPSDFNKDLLLLAGCPASKIHIIANAIDPDVFRVSASDRDSPLAKLPGGVPLVICVGRIEPQKNTEQFVQIGLSLLERGQPAHFVAVGDAVDTADYAARVRDSIPKRLRKHFSFVPRLRYDQMPTLYKLAAESGGCLVIPSRNESQRLRRTACWPPRS